MLKLNAGISRRVGEPDYGSRGASVNLELEVESNPVNNSDGLPDRIRKLFVLGRQAVDQELNGSKPATSSPARSNRNGATRERAATASQLRAIRTIADRLQLDAERVDAYAGPGQPGPQAGQRAHRQPQESQRHGNTPMVNRAKA
jgi:hypothetical protein